MSYFSDKLKELRKNKNLTQTELSNIINVKQGTYSRWENGKLEPTLENIVKLAKALDTSTDVLLGMTTNEDEIK